jgi:hypothetical protein
MATSSIRDEVQGQAAKDAAHREIAMCLLSSHMLLNWLKIGIQLIKNEESLALYGHNNSNQSRYLKCDNKYGFQIVKLLCAYRYPS